MERQAHLLFSYIFMQAVKENLISSPPYLLIPTLGETVR